MQVQDFRTWDANAPIETDLCIVGSGPAGLTIAGEFIGTGVRALVVESGGLVEDDDTDALSSIESVGAPRVMAPRLSRNRIFGGTSQTWTGRCAPFDEIDFAQRDWVPHSGWPIARSEVLPFLHRACDYLGLDPVDYDDSRFTAPLPAPDSRDHTLRHCAWQFSKDAIRPVDYMRFGPAFARRKAPNVRALIHATLSHITTDATGSRLVELEVSTLEGKRAVIRPRAVVLCSGGIENARILLCSNRIVSAGVGNARDVVGRFLMDHPRCALAEFDPSQASAISDHYGLFQLGRGINRHSFVRGITLSGTTQRDRQLLNCAAWLTEIRAPDDPWDAARRLLTRDRSHPARDAWRIVSQPGTIAKGLRNRLVGGQGLPRTLRALLLDCIVEQRPDPDSRLVLADRKDRLGLPISRLDWRISGQEKATVAALGDLIEQNFARRGLPRPKLADWVRRRDHTAAHFVDVSHPTGTTRIARDPRMGVVDEHCRVHGLDALFIAGSSVFPTSGHANPTLMIVALAIRLADRLKATLFASA